MYFKVCYVNDRISFLLGKMFKCVELPLLIQFFIMFYNDKPVDWLIDDLLSTKVCAIDMNAVSNI